MHQLSTILYGLLIVKSQEAKYLNHSQVTVAIAQVSSKIVAVIKGSKTDNAEPCPQNIRSKSEECLLKTETCNTSLPVELIYEILEHVKDQNTLFQLLQLNTTWNAVSSEKLYSSPSFSSIEKFEMFLNGASTFKNSLVRRIVFEPCSEGSFSSNSGLHEIGELNLFHSTLFRIMIRDRQKSDYIPHPYFFQILEQYPNIEAIIERKIGIDQTRDIRELITDDNDENYYSNALLARHLETCREFQQASLESLGLPSSNKTLNITPDMIIKLCKNLGKLGLSTSLGENFIGVAIKLHSKLGICITSQCRYMSYSGGKLMDCFTMISYRCSSLLRHTRSEILEEIKVDKIADKIVADQLNRVKAAVVILLKFFKRNHQTTDIIELMTFPTYCIDEESAKIIEYLLEFRVTDSEYKDDIYNCKIWLLEILKWYKVSKEMEIVREVLKNSMQRINYYLELEAKLAPLLLG